MTALHYLSVCSGIEAATVAWHALGWQPWAFSEIDRFPCEVLAHHYPSVPNLGDMTKFQEWPDGSTNILVGGTPCQSFSVAGLRKGLDDPRGNLMLVYGAIARRYRPRWLVWENVPGVLSSNGGRDFGTFLGMLAELGYVVDVDILDAQHFGLAQRRRRVFVCAQHRDDLLSAKTDSSALTITKCLQEILLAILVEASSKSGSEPVALESQEVWMSRDGALHRMQLFGIREEGKNWHKLLSNLGAAFTRSESARSNWDCFRGESEKERTAADRSMDSGTASRNTRTASSWSESLGDAYGVMKSFITSTATSSITTGQIFTCFEAALHIARLIARLSQSCPSWYGAASSALTALTGFTNYARFASSDLFGDMGRIHEWHSLEREAVRLCESIGNTRIECFGKVLSLSESLQGNPAPRRETWEVTTGTLTASTGGSDENDAQAGRLIPQWPAEVACTLNAHYGDKQGLEDQHALGGGNCSSLPRVAMCLNAGAMGRRDAESETLIPTLGGGFDVAHTRKGEGFDASEDGTGRGTPLVPVAHVPVMPTMMSGANTPAGHSARSGHSKDSYIVPVTTLAIRGRAGTPSLEARTDGTANAILTPNGGRASIGVGAIQYGMAVRRLTPVECERLQGFPDGYTDIRANGKPTPDGPRYKALGNSMAVPVMRWIGERIAMTDEIREEA